MTIIDYHQGGYVAPDLNTRVFGDLIFDPANPKLPHEAERYACGMTQWGWMAP